jgi:hypothetical protein
MTTFAGSTASYTPMHSAFCWTRHPPLPVAACSNPCRGSASLCSRPRRPLGVGFVHGVPAHLYLEHTEPEGLRELGLSPVEPGKQVDVYVRIPAARQSIFRGAVQRGGAPVCDILQVWLDVFAQPARGKEQADEIRRRVLATLFKSSRP